MHNQEESYWTTRYKEHSTGWDIGYPATPIKTYIDQLEDKSIKLLIPGAGNGYEAEYLLKKGFTNVHILDISEIPLQEFKKRNPTFPDTHVHHANFFELEGQFDLIIEQTFFCSFVPTVENRAAYAKQMAALLKEKGKLVGLWFSIPLTDDLEKRPFGGDKTSYLNYLNPYFTSKTFEPCYNSIPPRQGNELFGIFIKK
ncbi:Methyltransferase type 11 [Cellulophaga algicola DSM 14237]|uniref:Methyltransferase type 11 n=1 Tax=Cellulophaga algicola (strain DSM 14237 / IC166 / ACAM 630) TaxID=688270 RepID=E6X7T6_CELAD|nr:methyltransferase [Cellulophaga algicola]ADV47529.1 Methyltransferase type 11 [Cellulophaga algicola DSM 14237]